MSKPVEIDGQRLIIPHAGKCVQCGGPNPCFMHTPVTFRRKDGTTKTFENLPHACGFLFASIEDIERRIREYLPVVGS